MVNTVKLQDAVSELNLQMKLIVSFLLH